MQDDITKASNIITIVIDILIAQSQFQTGGKNIISF